MGLKDEHSHSSAVLQEKTQWSIKYFTNNQIIHIQPFAFVFGQSAPVLRSDPNQTRQ